MYSGEAARVAPGWWETKPFLLALVLLSALPLLWPDIPPLVDLPGHMGRYRVQLDIDTSPHLRNFYQFEWMLIGNLGVDLLIIPLSKLFGLGLAVKLIVLSIPPMTVAGFLWVAREVHGRVPAATLFAVPLAYNFPLLFGFVNFALSMAFAFLAFALWLRLGRLERLRLRAILFVPIGLAMWVTHTFGWGTLGVMAFSAELVRQHDKGGSYPRAAFHAGIHCLALAPPLLLMLAWRSNQVSGGTGDWFNLQAKMAWFTMVFRDRWMAFDVAALAVIVLLLIEALRHPRLEFSRNLAASALFLTAVFLLLPRIIFGSAYADMRLVPYLLAVAVIAIRARPGADFKGASLFAMAGLAFLLARTAGTTISMWMYDRDYDRQLAALEHVPIGARLASFVGRACGNDWRMSRFEHLPAMAIVRNHAFSNDQWAMAGAQLLSVQYPPGGRFVGDPSQIVVPERCPREMWLPIRRALTELPRKAFDYVWLIQPPPHDPALLRGFQPIWRDGTSVLYRVQDRTPPLAPVKEAE